MKTKKAAGIATVFLAVALTGWAVWNGMEQETGNSIAAIYGQKCRGKSNSHTEPFYSSHFNCGDKERLYCRDPATRKDFATARGQPCP